MPNTGIIQRGHRPLNHRLSLSLFPYNNETCPSHTEGNNIKTSKDEQQIDNDVERSFIGHRNKHLLSQILKRVIMRASSGLYYYQVSLLMILVFRDFMMFVQCC